jgi:3-aminobutyryl-CoA ammonia-lyase
MRKTAVLSYNMTSADAANPRGVVPAGKLFDFLGDAETEILILYDGDESLCISYEDIELFEEVYVGDQLEFHAELESVGNTSRRVRGKVVKLATPALRAGVAGAREGDMVWFDAPKLVMQSVGTFIVAKDRQRGAQPDGIVKNPWHPLDK